MEKKRRQLKTMKSITAVIVIAVTFSSTLLYLASGTSYLTMVSNVGSGPKQVVERYLELSQAGRVEEALKLWSRCNNDLSGYCAVATPRSGEEPIVGWTRWLAESQDPYKIIKVTEEIDGVYVHVETLFPNGISSTVIYILESRGDEWVIRELSSPAVIGVGRG